MHPIHRGSQEATGPSQSPRSPDAAPAPVPPRQRAGGSARGAPGIPGLPAAVVERVLMPSPGRHAGAGPGRGARPGGERGAGQRRKALAAAVAGAAAARRLIYRG